MIWKWTGFLKSLVSGRWKRQIDAEKNFLNSSSSADDFEIIIYFSMKMHENWIVTIAQRFGKSPVTREVRVRIPGWLHARWCLTWREWIYDYLTPRSEGKFLWSLNLGFIWCLQNPIYFNCNYGLVVWKVIRRAGCSGSNSASCLPVDASLRYAYDSMITKYSEGNFFL